NRIFNWSPNIKALLWLMGMVLSFQPLLWIKPVVIITVSVITMYLTKVSLHRYLKWFYAIIPFLLLSIAGIIFTVDSKPSTLVWYFKLFSVYAGISRAMLPIAWHVALQALTAIVCTYWFALTTPFTQIIKCLKKIHLPNVMIELTMLMYRFIFIFIEAFEKIYRAQKLRFGYDSFTLMIHSSGILAKMLFEQVIINYQMMVNALDAKLYDGDFYIS
ncbi:cobalt ECF transporter T component CbiQ, partial [Lactobacillus sp. XV13L]|nr:cobalt ECF transporter T component CbiQ [Lactobacillus sp. XV13L]